MQSVIALGFFDGVHLGHGDLLSKTAELARERGWRALALTFDRSPGKDGRLLTSVDDRVRLMRALYGIRDVAVLPFTAEFMGQSWDAFLESLVWDYEAAWLVCGWDYRFGHLGQGTPALLDAWCKSRGLGCDVLPARGIDGVTVSSTRIKALVEAGDVETAALFYGHPHTLSGIVQPGKHLGHTLGFPTANLLPPPELVLPKDGVYAVRATVAPAHKVSGQAMPVPAAGREDAHAFHGICNVGTNPTVDGKRRTVETWLSGFAGELYGRTLIVDFYCRLRDERRFESLEALQEEIFRNQAQAEAYFHQHPIR